VVALLVLCGDQASKWLVRQSLELGRSIPVLPPVLYVTYVQNTGAAFGMFRGHVTLFILLSVAVAAWIVAELRKRRGHGRATLLGLSLILGGAIGNVIDRLRFGYVVDFIDLRVWPVFNIADSAITIGVTLLLWQSFFGSKR
jgi:signal peptidase II